MEQNCSLASGGSLLGDSRLACGDSWEGEAVDHGPSSQYQALVVVIEEADCRDVLHRILRFAVVVNQVCLVDKVHQDDHSRLVV